MNGIRLCLLALCLGFVTNTMAQTEIHKCTDADGGIVYSQLPCAPEVPDVVEEDEADAVDEEAMPETETPFIVEQVDDGPPKTAEERRIAPTLLYFP